MKRVYHLLCEKWALSDLEHRRIKVARFGDLNDPFELLDAELSNADERRLFNRWKREATAKFGLLCFSTSWKNPVLWSHYADKHRGLCLGFDVPSSELHEVDYVDERTTFTDVDQDEGQPGSLFRTKFRDWAYEDECRRIINLADAHQERGHHFWPFGPDLTLREVIAGPRCNLAERRLKETLGVELEEVELTQARLAFRTFQVVPDLRGWKKGGTRGKTPEPDSTPAGTRP